MALFIQKNDDRSELQRRLAAELSEKAKAKAKLEAQPNDGVEDSAYIEGTKQTTSLAWIWIAIVIAAVAAIILIMFRVNS